jgi:hypothetical protein
MAFLVLSSLATIEFGLAGHGYRGSTATDLHQDLPNPRAAGDSLGCRR